MLKASLVNGSFTSFLFFLWYFCIISCFSFGVLYFQQYDVFCAFTGIITAVLVSALLSVSSLLSPDLIKVNFPYLTSRMLLYCQYKLQTSCMSVWARYSSFSQMHFHKNHLAKWSTFTFWQAHQSNLLLPFSFWCPSSHIHWDLISGGNDLINQKLIFCNISANGCEIYGGREKSSDWFLAGLLLMSSLSRCWAANGLVRLPVRVIQIEFWSHYPSVLQRWQI